MIAVDATRRIILDGCILVGGSRITHASSQQRQSVPAGARLISLPGRIIIPGLINTHAYLSQSAYVRTREDAGGAQDQRSSRQKRVGRRLTKHIGSSFQNRRRTFIIYFAVYCISEFILLFYTHVCQSHALRHRVTVHQRHPSR